MIVINKKSKAFIREYNISSIVKLKKRAPIKVTFFAGIQQVEFPRSSRNGERFLDTYHITNDRSRITEIVTPYATSLGGVEVSYLTGGSAKALIYRISYHEIDPESLESALHERLIEDMLAIRLLQLSLWLLKDNAADFDRGWICTGGRVNNNVWASRYSTANGSFDAVSFNAEEFSLARRPPVNSADRYIGSSDIPTLLSGGRLRYQRFMYFISSARSSADVAMKVADYCSALESLVSTAQTELSHQVSERVAAILTSPGAERIALFKLIKEAYGYRSKAVHGTYFKSRDFERLRVCSVRIDEICRRIHHAYFDLDTGLAQAIESSDEDTTEYFLNRTLG